MSFEEWWGKLSKDGLEHKTGVEMCRVIAYMAWAAALRPDIRPSAVTNQLKGLVDRLHAAAKYSREFGRHNNAPLLDEAGIEIHRLEQELAKAQQLAINIAEHDNAEFMRLGEILKQASDSSIANKPDADASASDGDKHS